MHPDECIRLGVQEFKRKSHKIVIQEMNIDQKILDQQRELLLKQQQQQEEAEKQQKLKEEKQAEESKKNKGQDAGTETKEKKKKSKKNKKKKGLSAFMEDDDEEAAFKIETDKTESPAEVESTVKAPPMIEEVQETLPTTAEEATKEEEDELDDSQAPSLPSILMKENEHSDKKTKVIFDETKNIVKEFRKNDKIDSALKKQHPGPKYKDESHDQLRPNKLRKTDASDQTNKENIVKEEEQSENQHPNKQPSKKPKTVDANQIGELQKSQAVIKARDALIMQSAPTNFYQFERDFKALSSDKAKLITYLLNIKGNNVKQIFKSDLEADVMLNIFNVFKDQPKEWIADNNKHLLEFLQSMQQVQPFNLACEFLMDDEISLIKDLFGKIAEASEDTETCQAIRTKFGQVNIQM